MREAPYKRYVEMELKLEALMRAQNDVVDLANNQHVPGVVDSSVRHM